jgi:hypothetical protein
LFLVHHRQSADFEPSMCRTALARSSSSRQEWMPGRVINRAC